MSNCQIFSVEKQYKVDVLNATEALKLFRRNALRNKEVDPSCTEIIRRAISYAGGLPLALALESIGSNLLGKTLDEWTSALDAYEKIPNISIPEILTVSYDGFEIFLDIVCFFKGCMQFEKSYKYVKCLWFSCRIWHQCSAK